MAAAKEFNIGTNTLIEFLVSKNFNADELKPTTKLKKKKPAKFSNLQKKVGLKHLLQSLAN
jgi:hypothetical protein